MICVCVWFHPAGCASCFWSCASVPWWRCTPWDRCSEGLGPGSIWRFCKCIPVEFSFQYMHGVNHLSHFLSLLGTHMGSLAGMGDLFSLCVFSLIYLPGQDWGSFVTVCLCGFSLIDMTYPCFPLLPILFGTPWMAVGISILTRFSCSKWAIQVRAVVCPCWTAYGPESRIMWHRAWLVVRNKSLSLYEQAPVSTE
jgi:hypothetical protein